MQVWFEVLHIFTWSTSVATNGQKLNREKLMKNRKNDFAFEKCMHLVDARFPSRVYCACALALLPEMGGILEQWSQSC